MNDNAANTLNMHLQQMRNEQRKQTAALEQIASALTELAATVKHLPR
ncbi:MAG: hypothetical protein PGN16_03640 [Sphingomonas phyllosphaerae]